MLLTKDISNLFAVEILIYVEMVYDIFQVSPLFSIHVLLAMPEMSWRQEKGMAN
jgi:hypothetical protein